MICDVAVRTACGPVSTKPRALPEHSTLLSAKMTSRIPSSSSQSASPRQTASVASAQTVRADVASSQTNRFCLYTPPIRSLCCHAAPSWPVNFVTAVSSSVIGHGPRLWLSSTQITISPCSPPRRRLNILVHLITRFGRWWFGKSKSVTAKSGRSGKGREWLNQSSRRRQVTDACARAVRCSLPFAAKRAACNTRLG